MILSQAQAEAVYSAMCALNNIGAHTDSFKLPDDKTVTLYGSEGSVGVSVKLRTIESYDSQAAFADAYNLQ